MNQTIKAVSFDAGGTLIHLCEPVGTTYSRIAGEFEIQAQPEPLELAFRSVWKATPPPFSGDCEMGEATWWKMVVKKVFETALGTTEFTSVANFDNFFDHLYGHFAEPGAWELDADALAVLDQLKELGIKTGIISNFDDRLLRILSDLKILDFFDPIVISNEIRSSKPAPEIFRFAISEFGLPAESILHIGDDPVCDVEGAKAAGMETHLVGPKGGKLIEIIPKLPLALGKSEDRIRASPI